MAGDGEHHDVHSACGGEMPEFSHPSPPAAAGRPEPEEASLTLGAPLVLPNPHSAHPSVPPPPLVPFVFPVSPGSWIFGDSGSAAFCVALDALATQHNVRMREQRRDASAR